MKRVAGIVIGVSIALFFWELIVRVTGTPHYILPGPVAVMWTLFDSRALIAEHAWITGIEVVSGILIGSLFGAYTALLMMIFPLARRMLLPFMVFSQAVPVFALAPILTLWLGYGIASKIVMTVLIIYFPVASAFFDGLRRTDPGLIDLATTMQATRTRILFHIRLPAALPSLGSGLRLAAVYAPIGAVIGEWVGSSKGLGYLMLLASGRAKIDLMFAALFVLATFTVLLHSAVSRLANRLASWSGKAA